MYEPKYYQGKKEEINKKFQKAQGKYYDICNMLGREFIDFQARVVELNEDLQKINNEEQESKKREEDGKKSKDNK